MPSCIVCNCTTSKATTRPSPSKPSSSSARTWTIWRSWSRERPPAREPLHRATDRATHASPVLKSLDDFQWSLAQENQPPAHPEPVPLAFVATETNIVLIGNVGVGKHPPGDRSGRCRLPERTLGAVHDGRDIINTLAAAQAVGQLQREFHRYLKLAILIVDESVTCRSTSTAQTCCSRSSASATNAHRS